MKYEYEINPMLDQTYIKQHVYFNAIFFAFNHNLPSEISNSNGKSNLTIGKK